MDNNILSRDPIRLVIGGLAIACQDACGSGTVEIPYSGMAFSQPRAEGQDLVLEVQMEEPDGGGTLLFGSDAFHPPFYVRRTERGDLRWILCKEDGSPKLSFRISEGWDRFLLTEDLSGDRGASMFREFGKIFAYSVLKHHACVLHGVLMEYEGRGILVTAASGVGKSTHTRMWRDRKNALILNGDRCLCRRTEDGWYGYGMPWAGSSGEYINRRVPISCIVALKRGETNSVRPLSEYEATIALMQRIFAPQWPGELQNLGFDRCDELGQVIPCLELSCTQEPEAVDVLEEGLRRYIFR